MHDKENAQVWEGCRITGRDLYLLYLDQISTSDLDLGLHQGEKRRVLLLI